MARVAVTANSNAALVAATDAANAFPNITQPSIIDCYVDTALQSSHQVDGPPLVAFGMQGSHTPLPICLNLALFPTPPPMCYVAPTPKTLMLLSLGDTLLTLKILLSSLLWLVTSEGCRILGGPQFSPPILIEGFHPFFLLQAIMFMGGPPPLQFSMGGTIFHQPEALPLWFREVPGFSSHALGGFLIPLHWWGRALILLVCLGILWHMRNFVPLWPLMQLCHFCLWAEPIHMWFKFFLWSHSRLLQFPTHLLLFLSLRFCCLHRLFTQSLSSGLSNTFFVSLNIQPVDQMTNLSWISSIWKQVECGRAKFSLPSRMGPSVFLLTTRATCTITAVLRCWWL
jgi:hypothetical protein